ncbi:phenylacetate-CoA oxygenase subunit PaaJ [Heyndrickxia sporothermodurans]|nr:phenylacetate-CoA oxygenase subunit PaaJ [Heyndrickxia sporothermodurans]
MTSNNELLMKVEKCLEQVNDPEIPSVSVIDLGMIEEISIHHSNHIQIKALPTFLGCPALEIIRNSIKNAVLQMDEIQTVEVEFIYHPPWTSDRISELGKERLKEFGIAPPPEFNEQNNEWKVECPYCGSYYTTMENLFGPTACRSILYCKACKNPFEAMKPVSNLM